MLAGWLAVPCRARPPVLAPLLFRVFDRSARYDSTRRLSLENNHVFALLSPLKLRSFIIFNLTCRQESKLEKNFSELEIREAYVGSSTSKFTPSLNITLFSFAQERSISLLMTT